MTAALRLTQDCLDEAVATPTPVPTLAPVTVVEVDNDRDNDGIVNEADRCPDLAEDADDHRDLDGCPDPDNDGDGGGDDDDGCPLDSKIDQHLARHYKYNSACLSSLTPFLCSQIITPFSKLMISTNQKTGL